MRIVFVSPRFSPEIGGVEKHVEFVSKELVKRNHDLTIITSTSNKDLMPFEVMHGVAVYRIFLHTFYWDRLNFWANLIGSWLLFIKMLPVLVKCDVLHLHDEKSFEWLYPFILFLKVLFGSKIFITFHGFEGYPVSRISKIIRRSAEKITNGNICVGSFISNWYGTKPDFTILGGVDPTTQNSDNFHNEAAIFVGRLAEDTGIVQYVEGLKILKDKYSIDMKLCICGDGPLRSQIQQYVEYNNLNVIFLGFVKHPEKLLGGYRYAFVSGYLAMLEAMLQKTLILAIYNNPLKKDYLYSFPNADKLFIIVSSPEELAKKINSAIINSEQIEERLELALAFVERLTWFNVAEVYLQLYRKKGLLSNA
jgi:glycosyltransferase involved in cell wall biosynthesis